MKTKILLSVLLSLNFFLLSSQVPQGFNYQAIARDGSGNAITGTTMQVKIGILSDTIANTMVWEELFNPVKTNAFGMFTIVVGTGVKQSGSASTFSAIDWTKTTLFLRTSIYYPSSWKVMVTTKLQSVPYSMVAGNLEGTVPLLSVKGNTTTMDSALFVVRNNTGQIVFAVYNEGVRIYVDDGVAKGARKGGFAIGSFDKSKGTSQPLFVVDPDSIRAYLDNNPTKAVKGGFAIGGFDRSKSANQNFLSVSKDSIRMYIDDNLLTKSTKGGFAIGSFDKSKGGNVNYLNVATDASGIINPSQNRILWYPIKNAFLTGKVLITDSANVGVNSFTSGFESKGKGDWSQALGFKAIANGDYSTAIGKNAFADKINSFAFGDSSRALNLESYAIGRGAVASGYRSFAFGSAGIDSTGTITDVARAKGDYSFAIGQGSQALGKGSFAFGLADTAKGNYSIALGYRTSAGYSATAFGYYTRATGQLSTAMGKGTIASGNQSTAIGSDNIANGEYSTAMGVGTTAIGFASTVMGSNTTANGPSSIAMGDNTTAGGGYSTAMGSQTTAIGVASIAMGSMTKAIGDYSTAMGYYTNAGGKYSTALGIFSTANGDYSTALGAGAQARGGASTSMGSQTIAKGDYSTAMGWSTIARGAGSTAIGFNTKAKPFASLSIGQYNDTTCTLGGDISWISTDPVFIIGIGTADNARNNAVTVLKNGNVGIGTATPASSLDVSGDIRSTNKIWADISGASGSYFRGGNDAELWDVNVANTLAIYGVENSAVATLRLGSGTADISGSGGNIGIGTTSPGYKLTVIGTTWCSSGVWTGSDIRWKKNIAEINDVLSNVLALRPVSYQWRTDDFPQMNFTNDVQIGLIAQDVEKVFPNLVMTDNNGYKAVSYEKLSVILVEGLKEQQKQIEGQQQIIEKQQAEIDHLKSLENDISELKTLVNTLVANQTGQGNK